MLRKLISLIDPTRDLRSSLRSLREWFRATLARAWRGAAFLDRRLIRRYFERHPDVRRLQLGCGKNPRVGWLNADLFPAQKEVVRVDVRRPLPFGDACFDFIFTEHLIEHIAWTDAERLVAECSRVLRPGGILRIATPDLRFLLGILGSERSALQDSYVAWTTERHIPWAPRIDPVIFANNFVRDWGHLFIHDESSLRLLLESAGFQGFARSEIGRSIHPDLNGLENEGRMPEGFLRLETIVVEVSRPEGTA